MKYLLRFFVISGLLFTPCYNLMAEFNLPFSVSFNVVEFGALGDGKTLDTKAIQSAIDSCAAEGGGVVSFPAGNYLTGTLFLKSNITFYLSAGATIWGSPDVKNYDNKCPIPSLIFARDVENIAIMGTGTINGQGIKFGGPGQFRPFPVLFMTSQRIRIENITIKDSPAWTLTLKGCDDVRIHGISILNNLSRVNNTDGIDPDCCHNVSISDCHIESGDDAIVIKSTKDLGYVRSSENISVSNCTIITRKTALKCGTETWGDIRNITFNNCTIKSSARGLGLWMRDGGTMENIIFSNITMDLMDIPNESMAGEPIRILLTKRNKDSKLGIINNIIMDNLTINAPYRCFLVGHVDQPIQGVTISNVRWNVDTGIKKKDPAPGYVGHSDMEMRNATPIDAIYGENIENLKLKDFIIKWVGAEKKKWRSTLYCENAKNIDVDGLHARQGIIGSIFPTVWMRNATDVFIHNCVATAGTSTFLKADGFETEKIVFICNELSRALRILETVNGAKKDRITILSNHMSKD